MANSHIFEIGGHRMVIRFTDNTDSDITLLPSFSSFSKKKAPIEDKNSMMDSNSLEEPSNSPLLFSLTIDDTLQPEREKTLIRHFDTGNGNTSVYRLSDGGYQYIIHDIHGRSCCLLICRNRFQDCWCALNGDWSMRSFGLNDAIMLAYAFAGAYHKTLLLHASCVMYGGKAFPFFAKSGTGKSTHTSLWMAHITGTQLMNDDNPVVRIMDNGEPFVYGSPWSGKTPCYRNIKAPLTALSRIERSENNRMERQSVVQAFASLLPAFSSMKWDTELYDCLCNTLSELISAVPVMTMYCKPDREAALVSHETLSKL